MRSGYPLSSTFHEPQVCLVSLKSCRLTAVADSSWMVSDRARRGFPRQPPGRSHPTSKIFMKQVELVTAASIDNIPSSRIKLNSPGVCLASPATRRVDSFPKASRLLKTTAYSHSGVDVAIPKSDAEIRSSPTSFGKRLFGQPQNCSAARLTCT